MTDVLDHPVVPSSSGTTGTSEPDRRVVPRASLPSGRAVLGGLLVALAALGTFLAYQGANGPPTTRYAVAVADLDPGTRLGADDIRLEPLDLPPDLAAGAFDDPAALDGAVTVAPVRAGELIQGSAVVPPGAGESAASPPAHEFSFAVDRTRAVNGSLNRGERIDLLATYGTGESARTHVVVRDALVVDIDNEASPTIGSAATITVTVALPSRDVVLEAAHAAQVAELTLVRATKGGADADEGASSFAGPGGSDAPPEPGP